MKDKELRGFEFLLLASQMLNIFKLSEPKIIEEMSWLKWVDDMYFLSTGAFVLFFFGYFKIDSLRINAITIILAQLCIFLEQQSLVPLNLKSVNLMAGLLFMTISSLVYYFFPVLRQVPVTGKFRVGYISTEISGSSVSIFYPTDDKYLKQTDAKYMPYSTYFDVLHYILMRMVKYRTKVIPPRWLVKLSGQPMANRLMGVINNGKLKILQQKTPLAIYSHGISSHKNYSASFCKDLASKGCIVISLQHKDEDFLYKLSSPSEETEFVNAMHQSVLRRKEQVKEVLDFALDKKNLASLFTNKDQIESSVSFSINSKVIMCGHSYGGQTAALSGLVDDRIYATIAIDPVMNLFSLPTFKTLIEKEVNKPFMVITTNNFNTNFPYYKQSEGLSLWMKNNKNSKKLLLPVKMKNTEHVDMIDAALFQSKELQFLRKDVFSPDTVTMNLIMLNKLAEFFIFEVLQNTTENIDCQRVLDKFEDICKNTIKQDNPLEVIKLENLHN